METSQHKSTLDESTSFIPTSYRLYIGIALLITTLFICVASISYVFTGSLDQDKLSLPFWELLLNSEVQCANFLGKLGAYVAHLLIYASFGISSLIFSYLLALVCIKLLAGFWMVKPLRTAQKSIFYLLWLPVLLGLIFNEHHAWIAGTYGLHVSTLLVNALGLFGTILILIGSYLIFFSAFYGLGIFKKMRDIIPSKSEGIEQKTSPLLKTTDVLSTEPMLDSTKKVLESTQKTIDLTPLKMPVEIAQEPAFIPPPPPLPIAPPSKDSGIDFEIEMPAAHNESALPEEETPTEEIPAITDEGEFFPYDPTLDLGNYKMPSLDLLNKYENVEVNVDREELEANKNKIINTLKDYKIEIDKIKATVGPTVTLYEIVPAAGVRISKIKSLEDDIALSLAALGIRIIAPIPGRGTIGIEVPNQSAEMVSMRSILASEKFTHTKMELPLALGKTISNETYIADLAKMPHLLMAGATGQGKSVGLNAILVSLLYKKHPSEIKFVLVDPKKVELTLFNKIENHYLAKLPDGGDAIITDTKKVVATLNSLCIEMDHRYDLLKKAAVRNLKEYNAKFTARKLNPENGHKFLPYIVLVIDEFADLIMTAGKEVETPIARLAQLARAIGIHLIIATQRPSVNIITGIIKANFPSRIAFRVTSKIDSRTILDSGGADQLIGKGDMLLSLGNDLIRIQCAFVDTPEVEGICDFIGNQRGYPSAFELPEYQDEAGGGNNVDLSSEERDEMFEEAARVVVSTQQGSTSMIQRKLKLGYNRAGRIMDQLEAAGIVGPSEGSKARQVLFPDEYTLEQYLRSLD